MSIVIVCADETPSSDCPGFGGVNIPVYAVSSSAWVYSYTAPACGGTAAFVPVYGLTTAHYVETDAGCPPASSLTFGVGGLTPPFDVSQLDQLQLTEAFAAGFIMVGIAWAIGFAVRTIVNFIRR